MKNSFIAYTLMLASITSVSPSYAIEKGDILTRARIITVSPNVNDNQVMAGGAPLAEPAGIDVDDATTLDADFTYMVTDNIGLELLLAIPLTHDIKGTGNLAGVDIGQAKVLPPALIAQYHFMPNNNIRPYAGAGINHTFFFDESTTNDFTSTMNSVLGGGVTSTGLDVEDEFGIVLQAGVDIDINKDWFFNADVKYISLEPTAKIKVNGVETAEVDFDLDPFVFGIGIGTKF